MLETLEAAGGIYVAVFALAIVSGVVPLFNAEIALIGLTIAVGSLPKALVFAGLIAIGQTISHSSLYFSARGVTKVTAKRRAKLEARIARARAIVERWGDKWLLLLCASATLGIPPMLLVSVAAGALEVRFRTYAIIAIIGRTVRFTALALAAHYL
ncbi:MAG TPA: VTT domain-containing protein [Kofleriaceae bacterium]